MPIEMLCSRFNPIGLGKFNCLVSSYLVTAVLIALLQLVAIENAYTQSVDNASQANTQNNIDIHSLLETVSRRTGKNFIVDPRVQATITVIAIDALEEDQLYESFLSILDVHGLAAVPAGKLIKIVPATVGVQGSVSVITDQYGANGENDELVTRVIAVKNVSAQQLIAVLRPLLPEAASISAEATSNTLVITDRAANINRLEKLVRSLDARD